MATATSSATERPFYSYQIQIGEQLFIKRLFVQKDRRFRQTNRAWIPLGDLSCFCFPFGYNSCLCHCEYIKEDFLDQVEDPDILWQRRILGYFPVVSLLRGICAIGKSIQMLYQLIIKGRYFAGMWQTQQDDAQRIIYKTYRIQPVEISFLQKGVILLHCVLYFFRGLVMCAQLGILLYPLDLLANCVWIAPYLKDERSVLFEAARMQYVCSDIRD